MTKMMKTKKNPTQFERVKGMIFVFADKADTNIMLFSFQLHYSSKLADRYCCHHPTIYSTEFISARSPCPRKYPSPLADTKSRPVKMHIVHHIRTI